MTEAVSERGFFLTIEGIDGCGKSTQAAMMREWLEKMRPSGAGRAILSTFEPGDWSGGALLRRLLLEPQENFPMTDRTELLLFLADRSGHLDTKIVPALEAGRTVICERYNDSTLAYQSWGRGLPREDIEKIFEGCRFPIPDATVLLDIDAGTARERLRRRGVPDRMESGGRDFMERVVRGYRELAAGYPERIVVIDASGEVEQVAERIRKALCARLEACCPQREQEKNP